MKISKLFHWLYAIVMLLPIFAIGITCGYAMFNKNAYQSYYGSLTNNETYVSQDMLTINNNEIYYLNTQNYSNTNNAFELYTNNFEIVENGNLGSSTLGNFNNYSSIRIYCRSNNLPEFYGINNDNTYTWITNSTFFVCKFKVNNVSSNTRSGVNGFYTIEYEELTYISEVFYYSVDKVIQSPYFNWAYDSFLVAPFSYIVTLFSMPSNSPVVMLLSYWLSISIIWLTFDLVMYVPLLVHRWLDKGAIE